MSTQLPIQKLIAACNPLQRSPWRVGPVTEAMVRECLVDGLFRSKPIRIDSPPHHHAQRIAYLVVNGWSDPIDIDVGVPSLHCYVDWIVQDGNHRLAAAMVRGDEEIAAEVSGCLQFASELLGVECDVPEFEKCTQ